jgi:hypothetical protein
LDELPDCPPKFDKIIAKSKADPSWKFTDGTWSPLQDEKKVLGDRVFAEKEARGVDRWVRASEIPGMTLFEDNARFQDTA